MIKVLGLALYGPLAASTRYRLGQYVPGLAELGIDLRLTGLLGDEYLRRRFNGGGLPLAALGNRPADRVLRQQGSIRYFRLASAHASQAKKRLFGRTVPGLTSA